MDLSPPLSALGGALRMQEGAFESENDDQDGFEDASHEPSEPSSSGEPTRHVHLIEEGTMKSIADVEDAPDVVTMTTGIDNLDVVLSSQGGFRRPFSYLLAGAPGSGKSRILVKSAAALIEQHRGLKVLYGCAEQSESEIKMSLRLPGFLTPKVMNHFFIRQGNVIDPLLEQATKMGITFLVVDSLNYYKTPQAGASEVAQLRAVAHLVTKWAHQAKAIAAIVAHINKDDKISGPKTVEHAVDAVLMMEKIYGEAGKRTKRRRLVSDKNRGNAEDIEGLFEMTETGIKEWSPEDEKRPARPHRVARRGEASAR